MSRWFGRRRQHRINLALQGGGAHGAFTWGVLDALLEDGRVEFEGVSGASAGAMNAAVLAHGLATGGREGARAALDAFWRAVADSAPFEAVLGADAETGAPAPAMRLILMLTKHLSPRQLNPFDINPLRNIVSAQIDFERLRNSCPIKVFISATRVSNGSLRIFRNAELDVAPLLASACLPTIHHAIEIDGEHYWDGAFAANPAVFPLIYECAAADVLLVLLTPHAYGDTPHTIDGVRARSIELAFNAAFLREMAAVQRARSYARSHRSLLPGFTRGRLERRLSDLHLHAIEAAELTAVLAAESRIATRLAFLEKLRDAGRSEAKAWLDTHARDLGHRTTLDLARRF